MRKAAVRVSLALCFSICIARAEESAERSFSFALFGDMPYPSAALPDADERYQRLIAHMNTFDVAFGVHIGDIKAGNTRCDDAVYSRNLGFFNMFRAPILFTPGDNEWTDCHRLNNGNYAPLDRLALIRSTFFATEMSLGQNPVMVKRQRDYPENARYIYGKIMVVTVNTPGSNNNQQQKISELVAGAPRENPYYDGDAEYTARNAANMAWLDEAFSFAIAHPVIRGVVVAFQANPFERFVEPLSGSNNNPYVRSGFEEFVTKLRARTLEMRGVGKVVLAAHGDTHIMRIGQVLTDTYPGCDPLIADKCVAVPFGGTPIDNFTRVEVFAQNNVHWIKVVVEPDNPRLFSFEPMYVPGN